MITYPHISPVALQLGPVAVHWYGIMYLIGFVSAWLLARHRSHQPYSMLSENDVSDLIFYAAIGVLVGGRVGYMLFYSFPTLIQDPLSLFKIWQGGMSFHGGFWGVALAVYLYSKKVKKPFLSVADFLTPFAPIGLGAGRIGNFINGELWGRISDVPWAMVFPSGGPYPRHPSMLYEFLLEGVLLFIILWIYSRKPRFAGSVSGLFLILYGAFRIFIEFFREPDAQLGYLAFNWLTMGQLLSIPMILVGMWLIMRKKPTKV